MGFLDELKGELWHKKITNNGLSKATGWHNCEACKYRMYDPKSDYLICYIRRIHVGANQICDDFSRGEPEYEIK